MNWCPIIFLLDVLSKRWTLHILKSISDWNNWFNDIKRSINWISAKILSERLTELENQLFIERKLINTKPLRVEYTFSKKGKSLEDVIKYINNWAIENNK